MPLKSVLLVAALLFAIQAPAAQASSGFAFGFLQSFSLDQITPNFFFGKHDRDDDDDDDDDRKKKEKHEDKYGNFFGNPHRQLQAQIDALEDRLDNLGDLGGGAGTPEYDLLADALQELSERLSELENPPAGPPVQPSLADWQVIDSSPDPKRFGGAITFLRDEEVQVIYDFQYDGSTHYLVIKLLNGLIFETTVGNAMFFEDADCQGIPYMKVYDPLYKSMFKTTPAGLLSDRLNGQFAELYVATSTDVEVVKVTGRRGPYSEEPGVCNQIDFGEIMIPAIYVEDLYDTFTPPFWVVPVE
jgi:hypothetical protein